MNESKKIKELNLINMQFAVHHKSFFDDYQKYAQSIADSIFNSKKEVGPIQNISSIPDEIYFYNIDNGYDYRFTISKKRTDIFFYPQDINEKYDDQVMYFFEKIKKYIINSLDQYTLIGKTSITSNSFLKKENPLQYLENNLLKYKNKKLKYINMTFCESDELEGIKINNNKIYYNQEFLSYDRAQKYNAVGITIDINTDGVLPNIERDKIFRFISKFEKSFVSDGVII